MEQCSSFLLYPKYIHFLLIPGTSPGIFFVFVEKKAILFDVPGEVTAARGLV